MFFQRLCQMIVCVTGVVVLAGRTPAADGVIQARQALFDRSQPKTLGLQTIPGEQTLLYRATKDSHRFCHHPNLVRFNGRLYCMWSNGLTNEDDLGQRILYADSENGLDWSTPRELAIDPQGRGACVSTGFLVSGSQLTVFYTVTVGQNFHPETALWAKISSDGRNWGQPQRVTSGFFIEAPRRLPGGRLLLCGENVGDARELKRMRLLYSDRSGGLDGWLEATITPGNLKTFGYTEPGWFQRNEDELVILFRNNSGFLYTSSSFDRGQSWTVPVKSNFPDSRARFSIGKLPDGTVFLINNPLSKLGDRSLLTIALSRDGVVFDRAFIVRGEPTKMRFPGRSKLDGWQYPCTLVHGSHILVAYSINKEDVGLTRIALSDLVDSR